MIYTLSLLMVVALIHIDSGHSRQQTTITPYLTNSTISLKWRAVIKHDAHLRLILTLSHTYPYKYAIPSSNEDNDATRGLVDDIVAFNDATRMHIFNYRIQMNIVMRTVVIIVLGQIAITSSILKDVPANMAGQ
eukprot:112752_1